ncbi:MAG TPA: PP2C family serine/threonine-protein phosphatase [Thermoanaerobaculia bacterium]|jgi:serine/threonine protein phosphatase PrpC|nr:PP2C family serine/threonine-protein phosphatase [Thermoanaerobaculia bacterium]
MSGDALASGAPLFRVGGASERGALHRKKDLPNQDKIDWYQPADGGLPVLLALSDGHGGDSYIRSHEGSRIAVEVALAVGRELAEQADDTHESKVKQEAEDRLLKRIVSEWLERVGEDLRARPITEEEWESLATAGPKVLDRLQKDERIAYGATLLLVIVTRRFLVFCQLGDGDILRIDPDGETQIVFPTSPDHVGEDTASLCMANAWREFQVQVVPIQDRHPPLILASTDGYSKSFVSTADFCRVGSDYLEMIRRDGVDAVQEQIPRFLAEASQGGSGDDISLGFIRCSEPDDFEAQHARMAELERRVSEKADRSETAEIRSHQQETSSALETLGRRCDRLESRTRKLLLLCVTSSVLSLVVVFLVVIWW